MISKLQLEYWKKIFKDSYILRMQADSFLMLIDKDTGSYHNIYATDEPGAKDILKELANTMDMHPAIKQE